MRPEVCVVWLKRDLRLEDHAAFFYAKKSKLPIIALYCFEPLLANYSDWDPRHWRFIYQSLNDLKKKIPITWSYTDIIPMLDHIQEHFTIKMIHSHEESGTEITYERDKSVARWCKRNLCSWKQYQSSGVVRGLKHGKNWDRLWIKYMERELYLFSKDELNFIDTTKLILNQDLADEIIHDHPLFSKGGEELAHASMKRFFEEFDFAKKIYTPSQGKYTTSGLSPYISWGNLSLRQVYHAAKKIVPLTEDKKNILQFISRLKYHCSFTQKFEVNTDLEFCRDGRKLNKELFKAWKHGQTGYPLIDASMRCVKATGHLNYRMRSMVMAFLSHHLNQPWEEGAKYLARQFLDYSPGIHYPQINLQSKASHNPLRQAMDKDQDAHFIKEWVPELREVPVMTIQRPWEITGVDYPFPVIKLWKWNL